MKQMKKRIHLSLLPLGYPYLKLLLLAIYAGVGAYGSFGSDGKLGLAAFSMDVLG